ncbi:MAG: signal peptide peptidase SppA [Planctomycetes bacterium]|nr:signal peptide peptidase SppA [Planctomycetota bacterium]
MNQDEPEYQNSQSTYGNSTPADPQYNYGTQPRPNMNKPKKKTSVAVYVIIGIFGTLATLFMFGITLIASLATIGQNMAEHSEFATDRLNEKVVQNGSANSGTIAIIPLNGVIDGGGSYYNGNGLVEFVTKQIRQAAADPNVSAVIFEVNSPGGGLTASDILYNEVLLLKNSGKKVIVSIDSLCASGGYYISAPADCIIAGPTSLVGSIGVIMSHYDISQLLANHGIKVEPIKSAKNKDILSPFREMTTDEREQTMRLTRHFHDRFVEIIAKGRKLDKADVMKFATGMIFTADEALDKKLIDKIGYFDQAIIEAQKLGGIYGTPRIIVYQKQMTLAQQLLGVTYNSEGQAVKSIMKELNEARTPAIEAHWTGK